MSHGEERAEEFLAALAFEDAWRNRDTDAMMGFFAEGAELVSSAPFPDLGSYRGEGEIRAFVLEHLGGDIRVDVTRKQVARNEVTWNVRAYRADDRAGWVGGVAEARFREGKLESLRLGAA
jgi:NTE family protein